jgi:hypothetical protein
MGAMSGDTAKRLRIDQLEATAARGSVNTERRTSSATIGVAPRAFDRSGRSWTAHDSVTNNPIGLGMRTPATLKRLTDSINTSGAMASAQVRTYAKHFLHAE